MQTWSFRDEILRMVSQWYIVLAFIVVGGLLGYGGTYLFPAPYRSTADLYVGIDVIRVGEMEHVIPLAKHEPLNLDDYKNWQLKQVADVLSSDKVVGRTLDALRGQDGYWNQVKAEDLKAWMDTYWYDAGIWRLEVVHLQAEYASQAVETWRDMGYARIEELLVYAERAAELDAELQSSNTSIGIVEERIANLEVFLTTAEEWDAELAALPGEQTLDEDTRLALETWLDQQAESGSAWDALIVSFPDTEADLQTYHDWLEEAHLGAQGALADSQAEQALLAAKREEALEEYNQAQDDSFGLSANLYLEPSFGVSQGARVRSTGTVTLASGGVGLLAWALMAFLRARGKEEVNAG